MPIPERCLVDPETAEAYRLGNMPADQARAFEDHFVACPKCEEVVRYVLAKEQVAQRRRDSHNHWVYVISLGAAAILKATGLRGCEALGLK